MVASATPNENCTMAMPMAIDDPDVVVYPRPGTYELWYTFQGNGGHVAVNLCWPSSLQPANLVPDVLVSFGRCGQLQPLVASERCALIFHAQAGVTYLLNYRSGSSVSNWQASMHPFPDGSNVTISVAQVVLPSNDVCSTATDLSIGGPSVVGNLTYALSDTNEIAIDNCASMSHLRMNPGLWYTFQGTGRRVWINTCFEGYIGGVLSIYTGSCGSASLKFAGGTCATECLTLLFPTLWNTTYRMLVHAGPRSDVRPANAVQLELTHEATNTVCARALPVVFGSLIAGAVTDTTLVDRSQAGNDNSSCAIDPNVPGLWYSFQGTGDSIWLNTSFGAAPSRVTVYKGACGRDTLQCVVGWTIRTEPDVVYHMLVQSSTRFFKLELTKFTPPVNDFCSGAIPLVLGSTVTGDITFATQDVTDPGRFSDNPGLWYTIKGTGGRLLIDACFSGGMRTFLSVFQENCGPTPLLPLQFEFMSCSLTLDSVFGMTYNVLARHNTISFYDRYGTGPRVPTFQLVAREMDFVSAPMAPTPVMVPPTNKPMAFGTTPMPVRVPSSAPVKPRSANPVTFQPVTMPVRVPSSAPVKPPAANPVTVKPVPMPQSPFAVPSKLSTRAPSESAVPPTTAKPARSPVTTASPFVRATTRAPASESTMAPVRESKVETAKPTRTTVVRSPQRPMPTAAPIRSARSPIASTTTAPNLSTRAPIVTDPLPAIKAPSTQPAVTTALPVRVANNAPSTMVTTPTPIGPGPLPPMTALFPVVTTASPIRVSKAPVTAPRALAPSKTPMAPKPIAAPMGAIPVATTPALPVLPTMAPKVANPRPVVTAPVTVNAPTVAPKCGWLGLRLFCPSTRCGLVGRLLGICQQ